MFPDLPKALNTKSKFRKRSELVGCLFLLLFFGFTIAVIIPVYRAARPIPERTLALSNAQQVGVDVTVYRNDFDDRLPPMESGIAAERAIEPYLGHGSDFERLKQATNSYQWNAVLSYRSIEEFSHPEETWMLHTREEVQGGYATAFLDGHAKSLAEEELTAVLAMPTEVLQAAAPAENSGKPPGARSGK